MIKAALIILVIIFYFLLTSDPTSSSNSSNQAPAPQVESAEVETSIPYEPETFNGYTCTEDCSGHEAGYEWADEKGIESIDDCGGNSDSFIEGCQSYVEENYPEEYDYDYEDIY